MKKIAGRLWCKSISILIQISVLPSCVLRQVIKSLCFSVHIFKIRRK